MTSDCVVYVHARFPDGVSELVGLYRTVRPEAGKSYGEFVYADTWLSGKRAFELDPENLPLQPGPFRTQGRGLLHGPFADATPDAWGRKLIGLTHPRGGPMLATDWLLETRNDRVGCLEFSRSQDARQQPLLARNHVSDLSKLAREFHQLDQGKPAGELATSLWLAGASLGGARPKAEVEFEGRLWIAKFQRASDTYDQCSAEHATMRLAARCGIDTPETRVVDVGPRKVVLVERFDRSPSKFRPTAHFISGLSALGLDDKAEDGSYSALAGFLARYAKDHRLDARQLFRRMVFNVLCGNRDDHLKNHGFLRDAAGWRLAPAFDVVPQPDMERQQAISVGDFGGLSTTSNCMSKVADFGLTKAEASSIRDELLKGMSGWREDFARDGVDPATIGRLEHAFSEELPTRTPTVLESIEESLPRSAYGTSKRKRSDDEEPPYSPPTP